MNSLYNDSNPKSIENYAKKLINKTFNDIINQYSIDEKSKKYITNDIMSKGSLGNLLEKYYFLYDPNSNSEADFPKAGVELKMSPYLKKKDGTLRAKERLVLSIINYMTDYNEIDFLKSHVYKKCSLMLLVYYLHDIEKNKLDYSIDYVSLFQFPKEDLEIIKKDYKIIIDKIRNGKAEDISESDTNYLGACTKGANSNSLRNQPFSNIKAMQRAFCLKNSYMTYILNNYITKNTSTYEPIIKDSNILKNQSLEKYVINQLSQYYNQDIYILKNSLNINYSVNNKSFTYLLAKKMLKISNENIEEFEKANIKIKAIRLQKNGMPKEAMSFPTFKYCEIINENWLDSNLYETFSTTKYLFIIFQYKEDGSLFFKKAMFWHVPENDLNTEIYRVWQETINRIKNNQYNNLPKSTESPILHVRPHAQNANNTYPTPDGKSAVKRCFWFNRSYIKKIIESED